MIKANNTYLARVIFNPYLQRLLKRNFNDFVLVGDFPSIDKSKSYIITPNHFSWWDGFFIDYLITKVTEHQIKIMMLEDQLKKYWFFKYLGAYSIDQTSINKISNSIKYSRELLSKPGNVLVIYPQGEIQKFHQEKFDLKKGIERISQEIITEIIPVAFKIEYDQNPKPTVFCKVGNITCSNDLKNNFSDYKNKFENNYKFLVSMDLSKDYNNNKIKSLFYGKHK